MFIEVTDTGTNKKITVNVAHIISISAQSVRGNEEGTLLTLTDAGKNELISVETYEQVINLVRRAGANVTSQALG